MANQQCYRSAKGWVVLFLGILPKTPAKALEQSIQITWLETKLGDCYLFIAAACGLAHTPTDPLLWKM